MTATLHTDHRLLPKVQGTPLPASRSMRLPTAGEPRLSLQQQVQKHEIQARQAAGEGKVAEAARLILQALQCERRLANTGPQVLQLIKPRS